MGIEIGELKPEKCKCYKLDDGLVCWRKGVIGTLSDSQEKRLCSSKEIKPATKELKERINKFTEAIHSAQERYHKEGITKWLVLVSEELKKRGIEV